MSATEPASSPRRRLRLRAIQHNLSRLGSQCTGEELAPDSRRGAAGARLDHLLPRLIRRPAHVEPLAVLPPEELPRLVARRQIRDGACPPIDRLSVGASRLRRERRRCCGGDRRHHRGMSRRRLRRLVRARDPSLTAPTIEAAFSMINLGEGEAPPLIRTLADTRPRIGIRQPSAVRQPHGFHGPRR